MGLHLSMSSAGGPKSEVHSHHSCPICRCRVPAPKLEEHLAFELSRVDEPCLKEETLEPSGARVPRAAAKKAKDLIVSKRSIARVQLDKNELLLERLRRHRHKRQRALDALAEGLPDSLEEIEMEAPSNGNERVECPICSQDLKLLEEFDRNAHVDRCLQTLEGAGEASASVDEYEWAGQTRVRATALLSETSSFEAAGWTVARQAPKIEGTAIATNGAEVDAESSDVNITDDVDDCRPKGSGTYTEHDLLKYMDQNDETVMTLLMSQSKKYKRDIDVVEGPIGDDSCLDAFMDGDYPIFEDKGTEGSQLKPLLTFEGITVKMARELEGNSRLIVEALLAKIQELRQQNPLVISHIKRKRTNERKVAEANPSGHDNKTHCLICIDAYQKPVVSTACWHVHCESCWLHALAIRRVCPQCQRITCPSDLHRIYL